MQVFSAQFRRIFNERSCHKMRETYLVIGFAVMGLLMVGLCVVLYQLMKQQGRLLLRLDQVERNLGIDAQAALNMEEARHSEGLAIGTSLTPFELSDLGGQALSLEGLRGKRVLLINWNPQCGFCDLMASELSQLQPDLRKHNVELLLAAHGAAEANRKLAREHALECPILLQNEGSHSIEAFKSLGTPAAYLLDEEGRVAKLLAVGSDNVLALAREAAGVHTKKKRLPGERDLAASRIEREGLKVGAPAPPFHLPDITGQTVSLEEFRGRKVLLVFTDPHCGPCDQVAPYLKQLHEQHRNNGLAVVMVGRGELEENRRKAEAHGFEFPVVLQQKWSLSKKYGIFATPVAFLIDEKGVIAKDVANGAVEIMALAPAEIAARKGV
jgi:peroxiredoxin